MTHHHNCQLNSLLLGLFENTNGTELHGLSGLAKSALNIVRDMRENFITETDIKCLSLLIEGLHADVDGDLINQYLSNEADCHICQAVIPSLKQKLA